jgi:hypothetical protein
MAANTRRPLKEYAVIYLVIELSQGRALREGRAVGRGAR